MIVVKVFGSTSYSMSYLVLNHGHRQMFVHLAKITGKRNGFVSGYPHQICSCYLHDCCRSPGHGLKSVNNAY